MDFSSLVGTVLNPGEFEINGKIIVINATTSHRLTLLWPELNGKGNGCGIGTMAEIFSIRFVDQLPIPTRSGERERTSTVGSDGQVVMIQVGVKGVQEEADKRLETMYEISPGRARKAQGAIEILVVDEEVIKSLCLAPAAERLYQEKVSREEARTQLERLANQVMKNVELNFLNGGKPTIIIQPKFPDGQKL